MSRPLLCETVTGRTIDDLRRKRDASHADMVELRLDGVRDPDVSAALDGRRRPAIVTCRPAWEGGEFTGSEVERRAILERALESGAEYVDVEWQAPFAADLVRAGGRRTVLSMHDFAAVPRDLADRVRAMRQLGPGVVKVAVAVERLSDALPLRDLARSAGPAVVIGMGPAGVPTRLLAAMLGSAWSYAGAGVAPGQVPAARMLEEFRFRDVTATTAIYGVAGNPVMQSLSPAMHNAAFAAAGLDAVYVPLQAADFDDFLAFANGMALSGASVTIPYKRDALAAATGADEDARRIGAANTLRRIPEGWEATNTDVAGFLAPLASAPLAGQRVSVLGAGGAAQAVVAGLVARGAQVTIHARDGHKARVLAERFGASAGEWPAADMPWDLLVNCTPVGSLASPDESPLPGGPFPGRLVYDLIYLPAETRLMREAREAGCEVLGGLPMLIAQAGAQFEWWTGRRAPVDVMRRAALTALESRGSRTPIPAGS